MGKLFFSRIDFVLVTISLFFSILALVLFQFQEFIFLALISSVLTLLFIGFTIGTLSVNVSEYLAKVLHMKEKFENVTIEELRREDDISLTSIGIVQTTLLFVLNYFQEIIDIQIVNGLIILTLVIFFIIRAIAKLRDNNRLRYFSIITLFTVIFVDIMTIIWILKFSLQIYFLISTVLVFILSMVFSAIKYRYIKDRVKNNPIYVI